MAFKRSFLSQNPYGLTDSIDNARKTMNSMVQATKKPSAPKKALEEATGKKFGFGSVANVATSLAFGFMDYSDRRDQGQGFVQSLGGAIVEGVLPEVMGLPLYFGYQALTGVGSMAVDMIESADAQMRQYNSMNKNQMPFRNYTFVDGPQIATMRQAGLALAQRSKYNLQQTLMGNEAQYLHR